MVENKDLNREIDKRVKIIDNKLKDAFSLIKKDIQDIKKNSTKTSKVDISSVENKIEQLKRELSQRPQTNIQSNSDHKEVEKLKLQLLELKKEQQLKEKITSEKAKQLKLEQKLALKKQEASILEKKSKELVNIIEQSNKNFTSNLKELQRQQEILIKQSREQQEKLLQETTDKQEQLKELYEAKIEEIKVQHSFDKAKTEAKYSEDLIKYSQEQDALKQEIYDLGKQLDKVQSRQIKQSTYTGPSFWSRLFSSPTKKPEVKVKKVNEQSQTFNFDWEVIKSPFLISIFNKIFIYSFITFLILIIVNSARIFSVDQYLNLNIFAIIISLLAILYLLLNKF